MKHLKTLFVFVVIASMLLAVAPGHVSAQGKFPSYASGIQVQNLSSQDALITLDYFNSENSATNPGAAAGSASDTIAPNGKGTYVPAPLSPFSGSLVISSSQPVAAVSNIQNGAKTAMASYVGNSSGATTLNLPLLVKNNGALPYDTWFSIQNAGSANANVSITYSDMVDPVTAVIKPGASKTFYQANEAHPTKVFAGTVTSDQPVVGVVVQENANRMLAYTAFLPESGTPNPVMPLINSNNNTIVTGVQIQNTSDTATDVTLSYTPASAVLGTACTETQSIPAHGSKTFALSAFNGTPLAGMTTDCAGGKKFVGSAKVTGNSANVNLVGIVNQNRTTTKVYSESYGAFNPALATEKVVLPLLLDRNGATNRLGTAFSLMNVGSAAVYYQCTFSNLPVGVTYGEQGQIQPNGSALVDQRNKVGTNYVGSGICTAYSDAAFTTVDTSAKLLATVNETSMLDTVLYDAFMVYEGINTH